MPTTPRLPAMAVEYKASRLLHRLRIERGELRLDLLQDAGFHVAAVGVQVVQLLRECAAFFGVAGQQHAHHVGGDIHASRGVDARRNAKGNGRRGRGFRAVAHFRKVQQAAQPGLPDVGKRTQAVGHKDAIFPLAAAPRRQPSQWRRA